MTVCINKGNPNFKKLSELYGDTLADLFVRQYSIQVKGLRGDFYYPTVKEFKNWLSSEKRGSLKLVDFALQTNPNLSENAILSLLKGVVNKYDGKIFITKGWTTSGVVIATIDQIETVFKPNLRLMMTLAEKYPKTFKIRSTSTPTTKIVEITAPKGLASEISGRTPDVKVRQKYFVDGNTQRLKNVLTKVATSSHPLNVVAQKLLEYADINDVKIILDPVDSYPSTYYEGRKATAYYDPSSNTIHLAENAPVKKGLYEKTILHEVLHALSYRTIKTDSNISNDFEKLYEAAVGKLGKYNPETGEGYYALTNKDEFFVALFTDSGFIKALQATSPIDNIKYTNLFEEIISYILNLLKLNTNENLYNQSFSVATNILEEAKQYELMMAQELDAMERTRQLEPPPDDFFLEAPIEQLPVKPGVAELFDSTPELANAVYDALGFKVDGIQVFKNKILSIIGKENIEDLYSKSDVKFNYFVIDTIEIGVGKELMITILTDKNQRTAFNLRTDGVYDKLKISEGSQTIRNIDARLSKTKFAIDFLIDEFKKVDKQEITPQQKQQAQQLYSQYLDTIFPESKVKDIVYHGTNTKFDKFNKSNLPDSGIYFDKNKTTAYGYGNILIPAILNSSGYYYGGNLNRVNSKQIRENGETGLTNGSGNVVFEPEQIHILGSKQDVQGFKEFVSKEAPSEPMFQLKGTEGSKASPKTIKLVKEFLKRIGVDFNEVNGIVVNGKKVDANAIADITQKMIQVVQGKTDTTLPEESMHFFVEIIEQTNPELFKKLLKEINNYSLLKEVFEQYGNNPYYQKDGKPDVIKLKKEAIGKVLAETIIKKQEGLTEKPELLEKTFSWWEAILDWLKRLVTSSAFDEAALKVISGEDIGTAEDIRDSQDEIYFSENKRDALYNKLVNVRKSISKDEDNPDEKKRGYYINGVKIAKRVTDIVNDWYERRFNEKQLSSSDFQKAVFDLKAEKGTAGHKDMENAFKLFVDDEGFLREEPLNDDSYTSVLNPDDRKMYETLRDNLRERLNSFPEGTRFLSEAIVYDEKRSGGGIAGTIDFLAITKEGQVNILDWKFMDLNVNKYEDVPWYKINAWRQQMQQYKIILERAYGVKADSFGQTRMIPIKAYYSEPNYKDEILPKLESIEIGNVKVELIDKDYLIPVGLEEETTGNKEVDELLVKLNGLYSRLSEQKATSEKAKREKAAQLNALFSAIRQLQMKKSIKPLIKQSKLLNKLIERLLANYEENWKTSTVDDKTDDAMNQMFEEIEILKLAALKTYSSLDVDLDFLFEGKELTEEDKELIESLKSVTHDTRKLTRKLDALETDFVLNFVAKREKTKDFMSPEKVIKGLSKFLSTTSVMQTRAIQTLFKKANRVLGYASMEAVEETRKLQDLKTAYDEWARSKGLSKRDYFSYIKKKDKNQLIDEFDKTFYSSLRKAIEERDYSWIIENVDKDEVRRVMQERLKEEIESIENVPSITEEDEKLKSINIKKAKDLYNVDTATSVGWLIYDVVKKAPRRDKWETDQWKELNAKNSKGEYINKPALDFYNYIRERNEYFQSINYINKSEARVFLPFVRKSLMEKIAMGGKVTIGEQFLKSISIDEGDVGYGKRDPLSGEIIDTIPVYLTKEIEGELSEDLFSTMSLYNELAIKFKYLSQIEYQAKALLSVERKKKSIATSYYGKTVIENGVLRYDDTNEENSQIYQKMMKAIIYQQKYIQDDNFDQLLTKVGKFGEKINKKLGMNIFPENLSERQVSINKVLDQLNNQFQFTVLGFNPLSALSNYLGGGFQSAINAGKYYTKTEFEKEMLWVTVDKMTSRTPEKYLAALEYFLPLTENYNRELSKKLSLSKLSQQSIQEVSMMLMRNGDWSVQTANFFAFINNSIVEDGKVVNVREYLRTLPEYENMYAGTDADRTNRKNKFEEDVKKLIEEKGVMKLATLNENGTLNIPGIDRKSDSVIELRRKVQAITKDALGNLSEDDLRLINLNIFGKSFMVFKNWIPRPVDVRMGNLKYNAGSDAYEWGRMRMVYRMLSWKLWESLSNMNNALKANEKGVEYMRELWEKKRQDYKDDTGKELEMTESEFMDLVRRNLRNQAMELVILLSLAAIVVGLKANAPDDDEDARVKNIHKFLVRAMDKLRDELLYFYNPGSILNLVSSGIFPSLSYLGNFMKLFKNFLTEVYAISVEDEKLEKETHVVKYLMKTFPIIYQGVTFLPMFYPELAKDLGIKTSTESRPMGL